MNEINYILIATQIGDLLKYQTSVNEIDRIGQSILRVSKESFPNPAITSVRAKTLYNWVLSLSKTPLESSERIKRLINFCLELTPEQHKQNTFDFFERNKRNPTAHEPAITWLIDKQDCLDILSLISFLYRQLDKAVYFRI